MINNQQNEWTKRQLFNNGTLVLRSSSGAETTIVLDPAVPTQTVILPIIMGVQVSIATVSQAFTTTPALINFNSDPINDDVITRTGGAFTILRDAILQTSLVLHVRQDTVSNNFRAWANVDGVDVPNSSVSMQLKTSGDTAQLLLPLILKLVAGQVIRFYGKTTNVNGATLVYEAADVNSPALTAAEVQFLALRGSI